MTIFMLQLLLRLAIIVVFFAIVIQMAKKPWLSIAVVLVGALACCHAKASARDYPNPQDLDVSLFLLCVVVLLLLRCIWWVEDHIKARKEREREQVERVPLSQEEQADVEHWLREGRG